MLIGDIGRFPIITLIMHTALYQTHKVCVKSLARLRECEKVSFSGRRSALTVGGQISETNEMHFSGKLRDSTPPTSDYILLMLRLIRVTKAGKCFLVYNIYLDYSVPRRMRLISA